MDSVNSQSSSCHDQSTTSVKIHNQAQAADASLASIMMPQDVESSLSSYYYYVSRVAESPYGGPLKHQLTSCEGLIDSVTNSSFYGLNICSNHNDGAGVIAARDLINVLMGVIPMCEQGPMARRICKHILWRIPGGDVNHNLTVVCVLSILLRLACQEHTLPYDAYFDYKVVNAMHDLGTMMLDVNLHARPPPQSELDTYCVERDGPKTFHIPIHENDPTGKDWEGSDLKFEVIVPSLLSTDLWYRCKNWVYGQYHGAHYEYFGRTRLYFSMGVLDLPPNWTLELASFDRPADLDEHIRGLYSRGVYDINRKYYWSSLSYGPAFNNSLAVSRSIMDILTKFEDPVQGDRFNDRIYKINQCVSGMFVPGTRVLMKDANTTSMSPGVIRSIAWDFHVRVLGNIKWSDDAEWLNMVNKYMYNKNNNNDRQGQENRRNSNRGGRSRRTHG